MTTSSEQEPVQTQAPGADGAVAAGNLDKVRDLIFDGQMRDYERNFARIEERLARETVLEYEAHVRRTRALLASTPRER